MRLKPYICIEKLNNIYFYGDINRKNVLQLTRYVRELDSKPSVKNINIHMASNGGDLDYGFLGYDLLKRSNKRINTFCEGPIASAGTLIYLAGSNRYITQNSTMLFHQLSGELKGTYENMSDYMNNCQLSMDCMKNIYKTETKFDDEFLNELLRKNIYLTAEKCVAYGIAHKII